MAPVVQHRGATLAIPRCLGGFLRGDGWFDILWRSCGDLEPLVEEFEQESGCQFEILPVKEKFGGLRIYGSGANDAKRQRLEAAKMESTRTC